MPSSRFAQLVPLLAVLGSVTFLGVGTSWAKQLFPLVGAQGTTAVRVGFSALLMLLVWRPWRWQLSRADARGVALYGAALGATNLSFYLSLRSIPFGIAVAIEFAGPLAMAILSSRRRVDLVWVGLAIAGLALLLPWAGTGARALDPVGVAFALAASAFWTAYIVFGKRVGHLHTGHSVSWGLLAASLVVVPVGVAHAGTALLSPVVLVVGLCVAALSSAIPIMLEMVALKRLPRGAFSIMLSMEPAVAALLAVPLLGEHLAATQWLAIVMVMAASMGSALTARQPVPAVVQAVA